MLGELPAGRRTRRTRRRTRKRRTRRILILFLANKSHGYKANQNLK